MSSEVAKDFVAILLTNYSAELLRQMCHKGQDRRRATEDSRDAEMVFRVFYEEKGVS